MAVDLRGRFEDPYPFWNASVGAPAERLRDDLELLPRLAEGGLCEAAKDISMAGALGTSLMLLECSGVGARIDLDAIPRPEGVDFERWLSAFPSYGFLLSVRDEHVDEVHACFAQRGLACAAIGSVDASREVVPNALVGGELDVLAAAVLGGASTTIAANRSISIQTISAATAIVC